MNTFKSDIYATVKGKYQKIGEVDSTYLVNSWGEYVLNPSTGKPYKVPVGYNPNDTIEKFQKFPVRMFASTY